jgi:RimJ/RimL family protein N-acetyltransferase
MRDRFPSPYALTDAENWLSTVSLSESPIDRYNFAICDPYNNVAIGSIGLMPAKDVERVSMEIGYWIGEDYWGRGIATEALKAFTSWAFENKAEVQRLHAGIFDGNVPSSRVLFKSGYVHEATLRRAVIKHGVVLDVHVYAMIREDWERLEKG